MSKVAPDPFLVQVLRGEALLEEVDDFVEEWHGGGFEQTLPEFLGMTEEEYALWLVEPEMLAHIIRARRYNMPLPDVVNDNYEELRVAARANDSGKAARLGRWLEQHGYID